MANWWEIALTTPEAFLLQKLKVVMNAVRCATLGRFASGDLIHHTTIDHPRTVSYMRVSGGAMSGRPAG